MELILIHEVLYSRIQIFYTVNIDSKKLKESHNIEDSIAGDRPG